MTDTEPRLIPRSDEDGIKAAIAIVDQYREQEIAKRAICVEAGRSPAPYDCRIIATSHIKERLQKALGEPTDVAPKGDT